MKWLLPLQKASGAVINSPVKAAQSLLVIKESKCWERSGSCRKKLRRPQNSPKMQQWPQEGGWRAGLNSRTSSRSKKLSSEGFKVCKDAELEKQQTKKCLIGKSRVRKRRREGAEKRE